MTLKSVSLQPRLFDYSSYKSYISDRLGAATTRGTKLQFAKFIGCQASYLSQVLNGKPHLTLEQAMRANRFFAHRKDEAKFFILLVEHGKAGSKETKDFFAEQLSEMQKERFHFKKRLLNTEDVSPEHQNRYYSTWYYVAIHMALLVPKFQDPRTLAEHFRLPVPTVREVIAFLEEAGLVKFQNGKYALAKRRIFLARDSHFIQRHHINWRSQALQAAEKNFPTNLHYSNVVAISQADFEKIKEYFVQTIERARKVIGPSPEESVYAIGLDIFEL